MKKHNKGFPFFLKLAATNIKKHRQEYLPYLLTCVMTIMMFYTIVSLSQNDTLKNMSGGTSMMMILSFGNWVIAIFAVVFLFYTNSFLIKRRKKEFGLFNILGMEKKHIAGVLALETLITGGISIVVGLLLGLLFNKLIFLLLLKIIHYDIQLGFQISPVALALTTLLFFGIFTLGLLYNLFQIRLANPVELLRGGKTGEREPKTKAVLAIAGFLCLGAGYAISLTVDKPLDALYLFLVAVILVIIGTYCLFTAGSIFILKQLRKNKHYYYQTSHFISVSGMIYRMKQNAIGLANICILSTMVLVVLSTTVSLYLGVDNIMTYLFPQDLYIRHYGDTFYADPKTVSDNIEAIVSEQGLQIKDYHDCSEFTMGTVRQGDTFDYHPGNTNYVTTSDVCMVQVITAEDYAALTGEAISITGNEVLAYGNLFDPGDTLTLFGTDYKVAQHLDDFPFQEAKYDTTFGLECLCLVVSDRAHMADIYEKQQTAYGADASSLNYDITFDLTGTDAQKIACNAALNAPGALVADAAIHGGAPIVSSDQLSIPRESGSFDVRCRQDQYRTFYYAYGGMFFLGLLLGTVFIMATVLIIYYKQISEGYDDKGRFTIMQNVGMSHAEVRRAIRSQVLTVFFLPLAMACVHIAFAFPVITKLLKLFSLTDTALFVQCTLGVIAIFALLYAGVYALTARAYYRIVSPGSISK